MSETSGAAISETVPRLFAARQQLQQLFQRVDAMETFVNGRLRPALQAGGTGGQGRARAGPARITDTDLLRAVPGGTGSGALKAEAVVGTGERDDKG